jgi:hypothetical protein
MEKSAMAFMSVPFQYQDALRHATIDDFSAISVLKQRKTISCAHHFDMERISTQAVLLLFVQYPKRYLSPVFLFQFQLVIRTWYPKKFNRSSTGYIRVLKKWLKKDDWPIQSTVFCFAQQTRPK